MHMKNAHVALLICASIFVTGCLITGDNHESTTGTRVADTTFDQIKPKSTTEDWVRVTLGPPTSDSILQDGGHVLKYVYTERKESTGAVFLIFGGHDEKRIDHTAFIEVHNGLVTNAWRQ
jgi:outer membrane protein assembly factor BamE (lipoprotein component of BamABCDE complex)